MINRKTIQIEKGEKKEYVMETLNVHVDRNT